MIRYGASTTLFYELYVNYQLKWSIFQPLRDFSKKSLDKQIELVRFTTLVRYPRDTDCRKRL